MDNTLIPSLPEFLNFFFVSLYVFGIYYSSKCLKDNFGKVCKKKEYSSFWESDGALKNIIWHLAFICFDLTIFFNYLKFFDPYKVFIDFAYFVLAFIIIVLMIVIIIIGTVVLSLVCERCLSAPEL